MSATTILITGDVPHMRRLLQFTVRNTGHTILKAESGETVIAMIDAQPVDLLIIDFGLQGMTGLETISALRKLESGATLPVILITARGDSGIREDAQATEVSAFITKPFSPVELTQLVNRLLAS
ncbi:MAG: response regulator [Candidatus Synoicihabitans palmerolidicus]|nr:response regulator [Candidatus Synoicihabitans palmerolidicus]